MSATDIYIRSLKGEQEIATQVNKLPIKHRSVLIMVDGKMNEQSLLSKLSSMFDGKAILSDLEQHGFVSRRTAPPAETTVTSKQSVMPAAPKASFLEGLVNKVKDMSEEYEGKAK